MYSQWGWETSLLRFLYGTLAKDEVRGGDVRREREEKEAEWLDGLCTEEQKPGSQVGITVFIQFHTG